jgi:hypothetical protein
MLAFFKYLRNPNPAAELINERIKGPLARVFFAEDSYFKYMIGDEQIEAPEEIDDRFYKRLFNALLFNHNDIVIHDLKGVNEPYREIVSIDKVISIQSHDSTIEKIAYTATTTVDDITYKGYVYMDAEQYQFLDQKFNPILIIPHDLGVCPADYISPEAYTDDVVRESMFTYVRGSLEEYAFLKTLQRMSNPNGVIPITTQLDAKIEKRQGNETDGPGGQPMGAQEISGQDQEYKKGVQGGYGVLQTGQNIKVPLNKKADGSYDVELAQHYINFFHLPVEPLNYLEKKIATVEQNIIISLLGDYSEANEAAKNELQVSKSYVSKEDKLRWLSMALSRIRNLSDKKLLGLKYGPDRVMVDHFYGSDFFQETEEELFTLFNNSPNGIERKNLLQRIAKSRNRFNPEKAMRETILYKLIPYASDKEFNLAVDQGVSPEIFELYTRFDYWITQFEAFYGDITVFYNSMEEVPESQRLMLINQLLNNLINKSTNNGTEENRAS